MTLTNLMTDDFGTYILEAAGLSQLPNFCLPSYRLYHKLSFASNFIHFEADLRMCGISKSGLN